MAFSAAERMYIAEQSESAKITFFLDGQTENKRSQCVKMRQKSVKVYYVYDLCGDFRFPNKTMPMVLIIS